MVSLVGEQWQCVNCVSVSPEAACSFNPRTGTAGVLVRGYVVSGCDDAYIPLKKRLHTDVALCHGGLSGSALTSTSAIPPKYS